MSCDHWWLCLNNKNGNPHGEFRCNWLFWLRTGGPAASSNKSAERRGTLWTSLPATRPLYGKLIIWWWQWPTQRHTNEQRQRHRKIQIQRGTLWKSSPATRPLYEISREVRKSGNRIKLTWSSKYFFLFVQKSWKGSEKNHKKSGLLPNRGGEGGLKRVKMA